ncbi:hypothetical protein ACNKHO_06210 [Shigella flexneri]
MKKTAIAIAVALAGFASVAQAAPQDNTWYAGGKLGWSRSMTPVEYQSDLNNNGSTHNSQLGAGALGRLPGLTRTLVSKSVTSARPYTDTKAPTNGALKAQGVQLTAKLGYPNYDLDMYTRLGGMVWRADSSNNIAGNPCDATTRAFPYSLAALSGL